MTVLLSLLFIVSGSDRRVAVASHANITVDGDVQDWSPGFAAVSPPAELTVFTHYREEDPPFSGDGDLQARVYAAWSAEGLSFLALVTDDDVQGDARNGEMWRGDCFETLIARRAGALHIGVNPAGDVHVFSGAITDAAKRQLKAAAQRTDTGYLIELFIPHAALDPLAANAQVGVNYSLRDVDKQQNDGRLVWSGIRHNLAASMGTLRLDPPPQATKWPACPRPTKTLRLDAPLQLHEGHLVVGRERVRLAMLNFQPASPSWAEQWSRFDPVSFTRALDAAARLGANALRLFLFFETFGGASPDPVMLQRLDWVVSEAAKRGMLSVVSFFADKKEFRRERWGEMEAHLRAITKAFANRREIAMWDLMNEPDHAFALPGAEFTAAEVNAWAVAMHAAVRDADPSHLVTIGLAGHYLRDANPSDDSRVAVGEVQSVHWYFPLSELGKGLTDALAARRAPLVLQELGFSAWHATNEEAAASYRLACREVNRLGVAGFGAWELFDHPTGAIPFLRPRIQDTHENHYGLIDAWGRPKPQAEAFCRCLGPVPRFAVPSAQGAP